MAKKKSSGLAGKLLWVLALLLMLSAAVYQRATGPTYPFRGVFTAGGVENTYRLIRSDLSIETNPAARAIIPDPGDGAAGTLFWKRYRTSDDFTAVPMNPETDEDGEKILVGLVPAQPAAGKVEYYIELFTPEGTTIEIPADEHVVMRFKDDVPATILVPHIFMMFFSVLIGIRAGLGAVFAPEGIRRMAWIALIGVTFGGMVLGPIVQKYAFGEYWTGFPNGGDWTDNKVLVLWLAWVVACAVIGLKPKKKEGVSRAVVLVASLVMSAAYVIPHSMGGSELDYSQVDAGIDPAEAIETGRQ